MLRASSKVVDEGVKTHAKNGNKKQPDSYLDVEDVGKFLRSNQKNKTQLALISLSVNIVRVVKEDKLIAAALNHKNHLTVSASLYDCSSLLFPYNKIIFVTERRWKQNKICRYRSSFEKRVKVLR